MQRTRKPTRKQKERLHRAGLPPENWLIVKEKPSGELLICNRRTEKFKVVPAEDGQPIKKENIMNYIYIGNDSGHSITPENPDKITVFLHDPSDSKKPPAMLNAYGTLAQYIRELSDTDCEERNMRKRFYYNGLCVLQKVEVLDYKSAKHVVKTVTEGSSFAEFID